jgi:hypothetical protein
VVWETWRLRRHEDFGCPIESGETLALRFAGVEMELHLQMPGEVAQSTQWEAKQMAANNPTITERLNKIADEVERKAKVPKTKDATTVNEALDRIAEAVKKLP